jgi:hypothetical protein
LRGVVLKEKPKGTHNSGLVEEKPKVESEEFILIDSRK